jgi:molecular chaperone GrpE (heat shock protein)
MENEEVKVEEAVEEIVKEEKPKKKANKKEELEKAIAEAEESTRKWYAVTAEYENYRRRTQNQAACAIRRVETT